MHNVHVHVSSCIIVHHDENDDNKKVLVSLRRFPGVILGSQEAVGLLRKTRRESPAHLSESQVGWPLMSGALQHS